MPLQWHNQLRPSFKGGSWKLRLWSVSASLAFQHLGESVTDAVVSLLQVFHAALAVALLIPAVMHHDEADIKALAEVKEMVSFLPRPALIMQMLLVLQVRIHRNIHNLSKKIHRHMKKRGYGPAITSLLVLT